MADPSAEEFDSWLRPREALSRLGAEREAASKKQIITRICDGRVRVAGHRSSQTGGMLDVGTKPSLVDGDYFVGLWSMRLEEFWSSGTLCFVRQTLAMPGFAAMTVVGAQGYAGQPEVHSFRGVRLDPLAMEREFDLDLQPAERKAPVPQNGRPAGKHGEPIARLTLRMRTMSAAEIQSYTAESLGAELIDEFIALGLKPPSVENAVRDAAGILRVIRK